VAQVGARIDGPRRGGVCGVLHGPNLAVLGAVAALGIGSTIFIGAAGSLIVAAAIVASVVVRPVTAGAAGAVRRTFTQQRLPQSSLTEILVGDGRRRAGAASSEQRAAVHAALGEPSRLAIVDQLAASDRSPQELQDIVGVQSNLLAHHLDVLEGAGLIERSRSSGDGRRRYVHLIHAGLEQLGPRARQVTGPVLFVCTANSARSQLAAGLWTATTGRPASSAGTHPAERVHPGAVAAATRAGVDLGDAEPTSLHALRRRPPLTITVCDRAHEELGPQPRWLHWSIPDPVNVGTAKAFDATVAELRQRIATIAGAA